jgi:dipeptidyl aminopeptidase/acylaminoacyl peptidase
VTASARVALLGLVLAIVPAPADAAGADPARDPSRADGVRIAFRRKCYDPAECDDVGNGVFGLRRRRPRLIRLTSDVSDRDPSWSPDGRRLAFARCDGDDCDLWTLDLAKSREERVTRGRLSDTEPTWSPGGRRLAFQRCRPGEKLRNSCELWSVGIAGGAPRRLTRNAVADGNPDWAWATGAIVFDHGRCRSGTTGCRRSSIRVLRRDGTVDKVAAPAHGAWGPRWDPAGRRIVHDVCVDVCIDVDEGPGSPLVIRHPIRGRRVVRSRWESASAPSFTPDGGRLLHALSTGDNGVVSVLALRGGREDVHHSYYGWVYSPDWRPPRAPD